jgi:DNA-binding NtrC family response regulator
VREGAYDFLVKPFGRERLETLLERVRERRALLEETRTLRTALESRYRFDRLVGRSPSMRALYELVERVAGTEASVLVRGESGTGKELIARSIHWNSPRRARPFVKVSCGSIPEGLLESELFGHEKGAFTSAASRRIGRFEEAGQGSIFLDEVGDLSPALQVKLLGVLQDRAFERLGSNRTIRTDARVIAATHRDLERRMADGTFRADLYYRLNVVPIPVPPLRDRREDIPLLAEHFLEANRAKYPKRSFALTAEALHLLCRHDWPGNVRELENAIERACVVAPGGRIRPEDLPPGVRPEAPAPFSGRGTLREVERDHVLRVLEECGGNRSRAARVLGIDRSSLLRKLREYEGADDSRRSSGGTEARA